MQAQVFVAEKCLKAPPNTPKNVLKVLSSKALKWLPHVCIQYISYII